jgi:hypothetical protein
MDHVNPDADYHEGKLRTAGSVEEHEGKRRTAFVG